VPASREQLRMFADKPRRDLAAANRALARLRAELGDEAVVRARLREGHLPEAGFAWEEVDEVPAPKPRDVDGGTLVRRIYTRPLALPARPRHEPDGWMLRDLKQGPVVRVLGPYVVSGGWWRKPVHRDYHYAETQRGELLWVFYDRARRRWFLQGRVE
jgi:protein ImuB